MPPFSIKLFLTAEEADTRLLLFSFGGSACVGVVSGQTPRYNASTKKTHPREKHCQENNAYLDFSVKVFLMRSLCLWLMHAFCHFCMRRLDFRRRSVRGLVKKLFEEQCVDKEKNTAYPRSRRSSSWSAICSLWRMRAFCHFCMRWLGFRRRGGRAKL